MYILYYAKVTPFLLRRIDTSVGTSRFLADTVVYDIGWKNLPGVGC